MDYVCANCGHEQEEQNKFGLCRACLQPKVVAKSFMEQIAGPKWKNAFLPLDHPESLKQEDLPHGVILK